jgi:hypothetical protein
LDEEAKTWRITSLPVFLLGSTFHGTKLLVKHQMDYGALHRKQSTLVVEPGVTQHAFAMIKSVGLHSGMPQRVFETKFQILWRGYDDQS